MLCFSFPLSCVTQWFDLISCMAQSLLNLIYFSHVLKKYVDGEVAQFFMTFYAVYIRLACWEIYDKDVDFLIRNILDTCL